MSKEEYVALFLHLTIMYLSSSLYRTVQESYLQKRLTVILHLQNIQEYLKRWKQSKVSCLFHTDSHTLFLPGLSATLAVWIGLLCMIYCTHPVHIRTVSHGSFSMDGQYDGK